MSLWDKLPEDIFNSEEMPEIWFTQELQFKVDFRDYIT